MEWSLETKTRTGRKTEGGVRQPPPLRSGKLIFIKKNNIERQD